MERVVVAGVGLGLVACACGTTVITAQPGHEWCIEVQTPKGSVSDPTAFDVFIAEPETNSDPQGCLCFSAAEDALLETGSGAEVLGQPWPAGYADLRDELIEAARLRCTQLALAQEPPLMYTDCLSVAVSLPYRSAIPGCTICVETGVWNGSEKEVECPPGSATPPRAAPTRARERRRPRRSSRPRDRRRWTRRACSTARETGCSDGRGGSHAMAIHFPCW